MKSRILIKNGFVVDGRNRDGFRGDVLTYGDEIEYVGKVQGESGDFETIDASGKIVCPGFIDSHSHSDAYLILEPDAPSKITQGITTEINGQCGGSAAPRYGEARLSSDWASLLGERLSWRSLGEYRRILEAARPAVNTVQFIGHNTLRSSVIGYAARAAEESEVREMERLLSDALDDGAWGLTTGLVYQPGKYAGETEVERLAALTAKKGGLYATHMKSEGDFLLESIDEVVSLARKVGIRAEISHLKTSGKRNWSKIDEAIAKVDKGVSEGVLLGVDRYPYLAAGTDLDIVLPDWAQEGAAAAECERLADPLLRERIAGEISASGRDWSEVMIGGTWSDETGYASGMRVSELGDDAGEVVCSILERDMCRTGAFFFSMSEDNLDRIIGMPWTVPGSDASLRAPWGALGTDFPHPRAYGTMPEFYGRLRASGFSVESAIARMTSVPAERFGLKRRGTIERGMFADIVIIDEGRFKAESTYAKPHSFSSGVECVMVNGAISYRNGAFTGKRNGRFLER